MNQPYIQIDAFTDRPFAGNPAGLCPLTAWPSAVHMQAIAAENNLAETAFFVPRDDPGEYDLRWFTPAVEVDLCGHATLATAFWLFRNAAAARDSLAFHTRSGALRVRRDGERVAMDFPVVRPLSAVVPEAVAPALGGPRPCDCQQMAEIHGAPYYLFIYESEAAVRGLAPDFGALAATGANVIASARGDDVDFVSRFFAPASGVDEDPVTGSSHCTLIPYWAAKLGRNSLRARQVSARGGDLWCRLDGDRVEIAGYCVEVKRAEILFEAAA